MIYFVLQEKNLSYYVKKPSDNIHVTDNKIHYFYQMGKFIADLGYNKESNSNTNSKQLPDVQNILLISIVDTPENKGNTRIVS